MKTMQIIKHGLGVAALVAATNSWGYFVGAVNVGNVDILLGITNALPNSSPGTETTWVNSLLNPDTAFDLKTENVSYSLVNSSDHIYAFELQANPDPGWYVVKNSQYWALFQNVSSTNWGVIDDSILPVGIHIGDGLTISHVTELGAAPQCPVEPCIPDTQDVPEPSSLGLLAAGMLGLAAARRFIRKA